MAVQSVNAEDRPIARRASVLLIVVGAMWLVRIVDTFRSSGVSVIGMGIVPRTWAGLYGIPIAPFVHVSWPHLIANTIPLLILGSLVLVGGVGEFLFVFITTSLLGGAGTWLLGAPHTQHVGASGVVFGLFGYLISRAAFDRKLSSVLITVVVGIAYGTAMLLSLVPQAGISWSGHFFGFLAGVAAARLRHPRRTGITQ
ncbi:MAG: rhomboid family intramembrane serine protease [Acidobacteriota bacterium]